MSQETIRSAGIPVQGRTMMDSQKFRVNWYGLSRKVLGRIARLVNERNWFASFIHPANVAIYGEGFMFATPEARAWALSGDYPFESIHNDMVEEWLVSNAVAAYWFRNPPPGKMPYIEVPNMESVEHVIVGGEESLTVSLIQNKKLDPTLKEKIGSRLFDAITKGVAFTIKRDDPDYDFAILKHGKTGSPLPSPAVTGILDDLDFVEAVKVGDWNGAYSRREIIRHTTKGYGVSSGPNAGTTRNNAKYKELQAILKAMTSILGKTDLATNFDQDLKWVTFPKDYFDDAITADAVRRLVMWGGLPAAVLLKTDAQIGGISALLHERTRASVEYFRSRFAPFLARIFNSKGFLFNFPNAPRMDAQWSVKSLYSTDSLIKLVTATTTHGITAPQTVRGMFGIADEEESALMRLAHARREDYTPPYEPRQGLLPSLFPQDFPGSSSASSSAGPAPEGSPGRPSNPT